MTPRVSIGVPVYNGEDYLAEALDSLLAQTFQDFEIIIADNGSSDGTESIARSYVARDPRVRYTRSDRNRGAAWNFNRVVELSRGEYFKWAAHDDVCGPRLLECCVEVLDGDPSVVLCHSGVRPIDARGAPLAPYDIRLKTDSSDPRVRYREIIRGVRGHLCYEIFGLMRAASLRKTPLMGDYPHGDGVLLARLAVLGRFHEVPEPLFSPRTHSKQSMSAIEDRYAYAAWFNPASSGRIVFPTWRVFWEYFRAIGAGPLTVPDRFWCFVYLLRSAVSYRRKLWRDVVVAGRHRFGRPLRREGQTAASDR